MSFDNYHHKKTQEGDIIKNEILKYIYFWRWFLLSIAVCLFCVSVYLKYSHTIYSTTSKIKILDEKESTLELPSASEIIKNNQINLENEIELLSSYPILNKVINQLNLNTTFYIVKIGPINNKENIMYVQRKLKKDKIETKVINK